MIDNHQKETIIPLLKEAGLPDGVINFVPGPGRYVGDPVLEKSGLAGVHFTGSTPVFQGMWKTIGSNIMSYRTYPRIVGETGGKDFVFVHSSADADAVATALIRGAFEYQGQKCSAASRAYIPSNLWPSIKERLSDEIKTIKMGDINDFTNFMGAVIDKPAFDSIVEFIEYAKNENGQFSDDPRIKSESIRSQTASLNRLVLDKSVHSLYENIVADELVYKPRAGQVPMPIPHGAQTSVVGTKAHRTMSDVVFG